MVKIYNNFRSEGSRLDPCLSLYKINASVFDYLRVNNLKITKYMSPPCHFYYYNNETDMMNHSILKDTFQKGLQHVEINLTDVTV